MERWDSGTGSAKNGDAADDKRALDAVEKREELDAEAAETGHKLCTAKKKERKKEINKNDETHNKNWQKIVYAIRST